VYSNRMFLPPSTVVKNLLIINGLVFLAQLTFQSKFPIHELFAQHHFLSKDFRPHQIITAMFMHGSWGHLFGNMLGLYFFGTKLEMVWGAKRFLTYYLICGLGAGVISGLATLVETYPIISDVNLLIEQANVRNFNMLYTKYDLTRYLTNMPQLNAMLSSDPNNPDAPKIILEVALKLKDAATASTVIGASGAVFGLIVGAGYLFPDDIIYFNFFIPIKMKWFALGYACIEFYAAIQNAPGDQVAHAAHLGGALIGFLMLYFSYRRGNRRKLF
jgi:membrane associated rhomboid family serine protease